MSRTNYPVDDGVVYLREATPQEIKRLRELTRDIMIDKVRKIVNENSNK